MLLRTPSVRTYFALAVLVGGLSAAACSAATTDPNVNGGALSMAGSGNAGSPTNNVAGGTSSAAGNGNTAGGAAIVPGAGGMDSAVAGAGGAPPGNGGAAMTPGAGAGGMVGGGGGGASAGGGAAGNGAGGWTMVDGRPSGPSPGCMAEEPIEPMTPVRHDLTVTVAEQYRPQYESRYYYTTLPENFDHTKQYPVVFRGNGCGQTSPEGGNFTGGAFATDVFVVQMIKADVDGDTVVPPSGSPGCFQAGRQGLADSPDGPYFDAVLADVAARYCIDMGQLYVSGWSSGAWLTNYLGCARGNVIRGTASGSGGLQADHGECTGGAAIMIFPGDAGSTQEGGVDIGAAAARDLFIATNGCSTTPVTMAFGNAGNCDYYGDCDAPVVYCNDGGGHGGPLDFMSDSAWEFWQSLP